MDEDINKNINAGIADWYKHYANHIDKMYDIFISSLNRMDKHHKSDSDRTYKNFVIYLYNNSSHILHEELYKDEE